jgi:sulfur relay (sulfurtransferase) DsrC/TusE family protein
LKKNILKNKDNQNNSVMNTISWDIILSLSESLSKIKINYLKSYYDNFEQFELDTKIKELAKICDEKVIRCDDC